MYYICTCISNEESVREGVRYEREISNGRDTGAWGQKA